MTAQDYTAVDSSLGLGVGNPLVASGRYASPVRVGQDVDVNNVAPVPTITGDTSGTPGTAVNLSSLVDDAGEADRTAGFTRAWSVTKNGNVFATGGNQINFSFTPDTSGTYVVTLQAMDKDSGQGSVIATVIASDLSLVAQPVSESQIDLAWSSNLSGIETYRMEVSFDGIEFTNASENTSAFSTASDSDLDSETTYYYRIVAVGAGGDLGTSNVAAATTSSSFDSASFNAPTAQVSSPTMHYLLAFNGARLGGEPIGNFWLSEAMQQANVSLTNIKQDGDAYPDNHEFTATTRLLSLIDVNSDNHLTAQEIADVDVSLLGYSWGAITAVNVSRLLTKSRYAGYRLDAEISVKTVTLVDAVNDVGLGAWLIRHVRGPVKTNVQKFRNYYHRNKGTDGVIDFGFGGGQFFYTDAWGNNFSDSLVGAVIPSLATDTVQIRVDTFWANREVVQQYTRGPNDPASWEGSQYGQDNNHDTMPWYTRQEYLADLGVVNPI